MRKTWALPVLVAGALQLAVAGCATQEDLGEYATKGDLSALRSELMDEIRKAQMSAEDAEGRANAAAASAEQAAKDAKAAADDAQAAAKKADAIFSKSLRK